MIMLNHSRFIQRWYSFWICFNKLNTYNSIRVSVTKQKNIYNLLFVIFIKFFLNLPWQNNVFVVQCLFLDGRGLEKLKIYVFNWIVPMKYGNVINDPKEGQVKTEIIEVAYDHKIKTYQV